MIPLFLGLVYKLLDIMLFFEIPDLPSEVYGYVDTFFSYLATGAGLLANYAPIQYLFTLFGIILIVDAAILVYHFIMWVLKKIPMLGME